MLKPVIAATAALAIAGSTLVYAQQRSDGHGGFGNGGRAEHQHRWLSPDDVAALGDGRSDRLVEGRVRIVHERQPLEAGVDGLADLGEELAEFRTRDDDDPEEADSSAVTEAPTV